MRCSARERERQLGAGYGFGIFVDNGFAGEINLNSVQRGSFQNAYVATGSTRRRPATATCPRRRVLARFAFDDLRLHRLQIAIIPRNSNSRRVMEKLRFREEGVALRYLEINGVWEDHVRYAITTEEWEERRAELTQLALVPLARVARAARSSRPSEPWASAAMCQALRSNAAPACVRAASRPASQTRSPSL